MLQSELEAIKKGDKACYIGTRAGSWPDVGTVVVRDFSWLDDEHSVKFKWVDKDGYSDWHFFSAEELEFIKE